MPVSHTSTDSYVIAGITVDMGGPALDVAFNRFVDGQQIGGPTMRLEGDAFLAVFGVPGDPGKPRAIDMADALYNAALTAGIITGVLS